MSDLVSWLEAHDKLAGWAQFAGATAALVLTYFTAFSPVWRRKKQLKVGGERLLLHGYEMLESYHRTSAQFLPFPLSIRAATLTMRGLVSEIERFPVFDLDDQGPNSLARRLLAVSITMDATRLFLEAKADAMDGHEGTLADQEEIRTFLAERLEMVTGLIRGDQLQRPVWPEEGTPSQ